jgi:hypothetical protein
VLFLVAVGQRFSVGGVRIAATVMAFGPFTFALYDIVTLPRLQARSPARCPARPPGETTRNG